MENDCLWLYNNSKIYCPNPVILVNRNFCYISRTRRVTDIEKSFPHFITCFPVLFLRFCILHMTSSYYTYYFIHLSLSPHLWMNIIERFYSTLNWALYRSSIRKHYIKLLSKLSYNGFGSFRSQIFHLNAVHII